ncbi:MAG: 4Fe-4S binding protein [Thaumarchaeota archaeon]|nr:4Fe-4S binding protein [Nitrososphaerota archaeon]
MAFAKEALRNIFRKPSTVQYPFERREPAEGLRGKPVWNMDKCIGCGICSMVCPVKAVEMIGKGKEAIIKHYLYRCIYCAQCAESCPVKAITMTTEFELSGSDKSAMIYVYNREKKSEK